MNKIKISNKIKNSVASCFACLSTDRALHPLGIYAEIFNNICELPNTRSSKVSLCWECTSVLRKVKLFKAKVEEAQSILKFHLVKKQNSLPCSLTNLTIVSKEIINITSIGIDGTKEEEETKTEICYSEDENDNPNVDDDFTLINDIKTENDTIVNDRTVNDTVVNDKIVNDRTVNDTVVNDKIVNDIKLNNKIANDKHESKRRNVKRCHFKYVFKDGTIQLSSYNRKIPIDNHDLKVLLDNEKNSDFYKKYKYKCKMCVHAWSKKNELDEHNGKYHNLSNPHICMICSRCYPDELSLAMHTSTHSYVYECSICLYRSHSGLIMNSHLKTHKKTVQCLHCGLYFQNITEFYPHYMEKHRTFICDHCNIKRRSKRMMEKHMRCHHQTHECTICKKRYKSLRSLRKHSYVSHLVGRSEDAYCAPCNKQFSNVFVYRRHVRTSTAHAKERDRVKKFPCPTCGKLYSRKSYMMNHYRYVHERRSKYYCTDCHQYFLNRTKYTDHMKYNHEGLTKAKNKLCNICGRGFSDNRTLEHHIRTHWGLRPHQCPHAGCGAAFTQRHAMQLHYKKHNTTTHKSNTK